MDQEMSQIKPKIKALQAFEVTARHSSFVHAGQELNVTPGAVRKHIRSLEREFKITLFTRTGKRLDLSEDGKNLFLDLRISFERIESAVLRLNEMRSNNAKCIKTLDGLKH